jgi:hypothetical protein
MSDLQQQFIQEIQTLQDSGAAMPLVFTPSEAFMLLAILQLVLRHPRVDGPTGEFARSFAENIEERLCKTPALKEVARQGWQPEHDV